MGCFNDLPTDVMWMIFKMYLTCVCKKYNVNQCIPFGGETSKQTETFALISRRSIDMIRKRTVLVEPLTWLDLINFNVHYKYQPIDSRGWKFKIAINGLL